MANAPDAETYHLAAAAYFESTDPAAPYVPESYAADGFIHCTHGLAHVIEAGNRYYRDDPRDYVALVIDLTAVGAAVVYEDAERIYPHIYGPLDRAAIIRAARVRRGDDGSFLGLESMS